MDFVEEWLLLEEKYEDVAYDYRPRLIEDSFRSRVKEMRIARRKARKEARLYEIYDRLSRLPDATQFVTRDLFALYLIPEEIREMYVRTHKVVGPGALATYDFAVIYRSPENLTGPTDFRVRANGSIIVPLAVVLCYPDILQGKLTASEVVQLRRRAAVDPNSAAVEAQNYIRRRSKGKEVVVVGEMNRSVKECCRLIEKISSYLDPYDDAIESLVEGNWLQMFGPNGIRDWSISIPIARANTLKCLYRMLIVMGCDVVRLLFENELAIIGAILIDYGDQCSEPRRKWTPCANVENHDSVGGFDKPLDSPPLSDELIKVGEVETLGMLSQSLRLCFEKRKANMLSVKSRRGTCFGNAVDIGGNALLTCSHVAEAVMPGFYNSLAEYGHTQHLCLLESSDVWQGEWPVRVPEVGELAVYLFVVDDEVRYSAPVVVLRLEEDHVVTSANPVMGRGRSGAALVSLTDLSLLGLFTARLDDLLVSVILSPSLRRSIFSVTSGISRRRCDNSFERGMAPTRTALVSSYIVSDSMIYMNHPSGMINCSIEDNDLVETLDQASRMPASVTHRLPEPKELCRIVFYVNTELLWSELHQFDSLESGINPGLCLPALSKPQWCPIVAELDLAVVGFKKVAPDGTLSGSERALLTKPEVLTVFKGQEQSLLAEAIGQETMDEVKEELLSFVSGKLKPSNGDFEFAEVVADTANLELTEVQIEYAGVLLDYEFYVDVVGERAINSTYIELSLSRSRSNLVSGKAKFVCVVLEYIRLRLGREILSALIKHIEVGSILEPA